MSVKKPYKRNIRQFIDGEFFEGGRWMYILHEDYANSPEHYVRAFLILQKDFLNLLDYIEPADSNLNTYSFRIHELLLRVCIEVEANCVAILMENGYKKEGDWNMSDYKKINESHRLSSYEVKLPIWNGERNIRTPFKKWKVDEKLPWWGAYNETKHSRHIEFKKATFEYLTDAMCGLIAVLSSQFLDHDFSSADWKRSIGGHNDGMDTTIGEYFRVKYPTDWLSEDKYDFTWQELEVESHPIEKINYE